MLQPTVAETAQAVAALSDVGAADHRLIEPVGGVPATAEPAWQFTADAVGVLRAHEAEHGAARQRPGRAEIARTWALGRGRISSTELGSLLRASPTNVQGVLKSLERDGVLAPGRATRRGAGFFYVPTAEP